mgnify:CR=1 FL=1
MRLFLLDTTHNDKALRISSAAGGTIGGTLDFSSAFSAAVATTSDTHNHTITVNNHTLTAAQSGMPAHNHDFNMLGFSGEGTTWPFSSNGSLFATGTTKNAPAQNASEGHNHGASSGNDAHNHTSNINVKYVDSIICTRD